jgi:hypothetical protein
VAAHRTKLQPRRIVDPDLQRRFVIVDHARLTPMHEATYVTQPVPISA